MPENNDELKNSEEFKRMRHLAGLQEEDWDDDDDDEMEDFNAPQYIALYTTIAKISMSAIKSIKEQDAENVFDETSTWDLAERSMKPILKAIEEVYDIGTVLED